MHLELYRPEKKDTKVKVSFDTWNIYVHYSGHVYKRGSAKACLETEDKLESNLFFLRVFSQRTYTGRVHLQVTGKHTYSCFIWFSYQRLEVRFEPQIKFHFVWNCTLRECKC